VALVEEPLAHFARHVRLGPSHEPAGGDGEDDSVGTSAGGTQQPDLVGVLHSADLTQGLGGQAEGGAREAGLETHDVERPEMVGEEEPAALGAGGQRGGHGQGRVVGLAPGGDGKQSADAGRRTTGRIPLQARHDQRGGTVGGQDEHRQPLQGHGRVAGQPAQLRSDADEQRGGPSLSQRRAGCVEALGIPGGRDHRAPDSFPAPFPAPERVANQAATTSGPSACILR